jgi:hypothetical protein
MYHAGWTGVLIMSCCLQPGTWLHPIPAWCMYVCVSVYVVCTREIEVREGRLRGLASWSDHCIFGRGGYRGCITVAVSKQDFLGKETEMYLSCNGMCCAIKPFFYINMKQKIRYLAEAIGSSP